MSARNFPGSKENPRTHATTHMALSCRRFFTKNRDGISLTDWLNASQKMTASAKS